MNHERVLLISPELPPKVGGVGQSALRLAAGLADAGCVVTVLTQLRNGRLDQSPEIETESESYPFEVVRVGPMRRPGQRVAKTLRSQLQRMFLETAVDHLRGRFTPDVVLTLTVNVTGFLGTCIARSLGAPHIGSARGLDIGSGIFRPDFLPFTQMVIERSTAITFVNEYLLRTAEMVFGPRPEFRVIHNGVRPMPPEVVERKAQLRRDLRQRLGVADDEFLVGYSGTFRAKKGIRCLQGGFDRFCERWPKARLLIVGGPRYDEERALAGAFFDGGPTSWRVQSTGLLEDRAEVLSYYAAMDCAVVPSIEDGLPNAMLEAMAMGLPVVASDIFDDVIDHGDNGLLVPRHDEEALAAALARVASDPALARRLGERAAEATIRSFSNNTETEAYLRLFQEVSRRQDPLHARA